MSEVQRITVVGYSDDKGCQKTKTEREKECSKGNERQRVCGTREGS